MPLNFKSPLSWPEGLPVTPRNQQRNDHGFSAQMSLADSIRYLEEEINDLGINNAALSLDIEQPLVDRLRRKVGSRTGVSLFFKMHHRPYVIACDRWQMIEHNVYALHLTFRQWRNIERWGIGTIPMLLNGFEADRLPESDHSAVEAPLEEWMELLGLGPTATLEDAIAVYHRRAKLVADSTEQLTRLNLVMDTARAYFAKRKTAS